MSVVSGCGLFSPLQLLAGSTSPAGHTTTTQHTPAGTVAKILSTVHSIFIVHVYQLKIVHSITAYLGGGRCGVGIVAAIDCVPITEGGRPAVATLSLSISSHSSKSSPIKQSKSSSKHSPVAIPPSASSGGSMPYDAWCVGGL